LSDCENVDSVQSESLSWSGSKFQTVGPATENDSGSIQKMGERRLSLLVVMGSNMVVI